MLSSFSSLGELSIWCLILNKNKCEEKAHSDYSTSLTSDVSVFSIRESWQLSEAGEGTSPVDSTFELTIHIQRIRDSDANIICS